MSLIHEERISAGTGSIVETLIGDEDIISNSSSAVHEENALSTVISCGQTGSEI